MWGTIKNVRSSVSGCKGKGNDKHSVGSGLVVDRAWLSCIDGE